MKKFLKIALILFIIGMVAAIGTWIYVFHKPARNIAKEKPAYVMEAQQLFSDFQKDESASYTKYGNKVIELSGKVVNVTIGSNTASVTLLDEMEGINCSFDSLTVAKTGDELSKIAVGNEIKLKGQCDGYDMIMGVVLTRCVLLKD